MSYLLIRKLLEEKLATISPSISTSYENLNFQPVNGTPWQRLELSSKIGNPTFGDNLKRETGILMLNLMYPLNAGPGAANARADIVRTTFYRGLTLSSGAVRISIDKTPEIHQGFKDEGWYNLPISVFFTADIY